MDRLLDLNKEVLNILSLEIKHLGLYPFFSENYAVAALAKKANTQKLLKTAEKWKWNAFPVRKYWRKFISGTRDPQSSTLYTYVLFMSGLNFIQKDPFKE